MAVSDYSTTPGSNTSISGINIAEGCPPANVNNAIRQLMADVKGYTATVIPFTPAGGIAATTVAAAIAEARSDAIAAIPGVVTTSANGLMSAADKTKLNGIAAGAQVNPAAISQANWNSGTSTTEGPISPAKLLAAVHNHIFGTVQTWQNVLGSRSSGTTYTNSTDRPITVAVQLQANSSTANWLQVSHDGATWINIARSSPQSGVMIAASAQVPPGGRYRVSGGGLDAWSELR